MLDTLIKLQATLLCTKMSSVKRYNTTDIEETCKTYTINALNQT